MKNKHTKLKTFNLEKYSTAAGIEWTGRKSYRLEEGKVGDANAKLKDPWQ